MQLVMQFIWWNVKTQKDIRKKYYPLKSKMLGNHFLGCFHDISISYLNQMANWKCSSNIHIIGYSNILIYDKTRKTRYLMMAWSPKIGVWIFFVFFQNLIMWHSGKNQIWHLNTPTDSMELMEIWHSMMRFSDHTKPAI